MATVVHFAEVEPGADLRKQVRDLLRGWLADDERVWSLEVVAAELVSAVEHSRHPIGLKLRSDGRMARLDLLLANGDRPAAPTGYSLRVLRALTIDFGESNGNRGGGVWAHLQF